MHRAGCRRAPHRAASGSPDRGAWPTRPAFGAIEHPTGPTDVVLRYEEGGGFVMPAFLATQAPHFTLYGDGTIVFRNPMHGSARADRIGLPDAIRSGPPG